MSDKKMTKARLVQLMQWAAEFGRQHGKAWADGVATETGMVSFRDYIKGVAEGNWGHE